MAANNNTIISSMKSAAKACTSGTLIDERAKKEFCEGSIVNIRLKNFVTYNEVSLRCTPGLNLILGPNGTGKSSIVCAICLGLGGHPKLLGRADKINAFVKRGCERGEIELDLYRKKAGLLRIKRCINSTDNSSKWFINGKDCKQETVKTEIEKLNIQLANLCQFLPQDKVVEFAKMDKYKLLRATEQAIGDPELDEKHQQLIDLRIRSQNSTEQLGVSTSEYKRLEQSNQLVEGDVQRFLERQKISEKIKELSQKKALIEYRISRDVWTSAKERKKEAQTQLRKAEELLEPAQKVIARLDKEIQATRQELGSLNTRSQNNIRKMNQLFERVTEMESDLTKPLKELANKKKQEETRKERIKLLENEIKSLESELKDLPKTEDVQPKVKEINYQLEKLDNNSRKIKDQLYEVNNEKTKLSRIQEDFKRELAKLNDIREQRLALIKKSDIDTFKALQWITNNPNNFKSKVFEPLITVVNSKVQKYTKIVENCIRANERYAFLTQNNEDLITCVSVIRERQNLRIDLVCVPAKTLQDFKLPYPLEHIKKFGFETYLLDIIDVPEPILVYMCEYFRVHMMPIHKNAEINDQEMANIQKNLPNITSFYTQDMRYSISVSRYSGKRIIHTDIIRKPYFLAMNIQTGRKEELQRETSDLSMKLVDIDKNMSQLETNDREFRTEFDKLKTEKNNLINCNSSRRKLEKNIEIKLVKLNETEKNSFNLKVEEKKCKEAMNIIEEERIQTLSNVVDISEKIQILLKDRTSMNVQICQSMMKKNDHQKSLRDYNSEIERCHILVSELNDNEKQAKEVASKLLSEVESLIGHKITAIPDSMKQNLMQGVDEENALEKIEGQLHEYQAKEDLCLNTDPTVIQKYNENKKKIADMQKKLKSEKSHQEAVKQEIEKLKEEWVVPLKQLLDDVSEKFSDFFARISCCGEVKLDIDETEGEYAFDKYGIGINVKFRDNEKLQQLTRFHQSGGERSVSTILYLMALQQHAQSPFRVVDEINQGMDSHYERCVFDFITQTASRENTSQYFLLSPKLLTGLKYSKDMAVHFVGNGPGVGHALTPF